MTKENDDIRKKISEDYAAAVNGTGSCCSDGAVSSLAGYNKDELENHGEGVATSTFGCGNPLAFSEVKKGQTVLDLGSGPGLDLMLAARKVGPKGQVIGVDMTDDMIARATSNIEASPYDNIEVRKGIIEALPIEDNSVDWVISNCVINLSPEKDKVFAEIQRVLKPGGRMRVSDIVAEELPESIRKDVELYSACIGGAVSEADYIAGLRSAGLTNVEVKERMVYSAPQLEAMVDELTDAGRVSAEATSCCDLSLPDLAGRVWSALVVAEKPKS